MLFSQRKKLEEEYYQWLEKTGKEHGVKVEDCPFNMIGFLEIKGLLKDEIKISENKYFYSKGDILNMYLEPQPYPKEYATIALNYNFLKGENVYYNDNQIGKATKVYLNNEKIYIQFVLFRDSEIPENPCICYDGKELYIGSVNLSTEQT